MAIYDRGYYWVQPLNRPISSLFGTMSNLFQGRSQHPRSKAGYSSQYILMIPHSYSMKPLFKRFPKMRALPNHRKNDRFSIENPLFWGFLKVKKKTPETHHHATPVASQRSAARCAAPPHPAAGDELRDCEDHAGRGARAGRTARQREWCTPGDMEELLILTMGKKRSSAFCGGMGCICDVYVCIYLSIYLFIYLFIYLIFMHSFIHLFTDVYIYTHCMCV